jgi:tetratricopeptide (TPR) repeat protein
MNFRNRKNKIPSLAIAMLAVFGAIWVSGCAPHDQSPLPEMHLKADAMIGGGRLEEAGKFIDSCLAVAPDDATLHYQKALCLDMVAQYSQLQIELGLALKYLPSDSCDLRQRIMEHRGHSNRYASLRRKAFDDYLAAYQVAVNCPPVEQQDSFNNLLNAGSMASSFDVKLSDSIAQVLIARFPAKIEGYEMRAAARNVPGKYHLARSEYDSIIMRFEGNPEVNTGLTYYCRGLACQGMNDFEAACTDWGQALALGVAWAQPKLDSFCTQR